MNCPYCNNSETKVTDSRESKDGNSIKRRRECLNCQKRFSTIEKVLKLDLEVRKNNGEIEVFSLPKIKKSLMKCCVKRPITLEEIDKTIDKIIKDLKAENTQIIPTSKVGKIVLKNLKNLDEIAFLRYIIVYNNYEDVSEFLSELDSLKLSKLK